MHEDEKLLVVREQRSRQVAHVLVRAVHMPFGEGKELSLQREDLVDQLRTRERPAAGRRIAAKAVPQAKQSGMEGQRVATESLGVGRLDELERAQDVALEVRPAELQLAAMIRLVGSPAIATQHPREDIPEQRDEDVRRAGRSNPVHDKHRGHHGPEPPFLAIGPMARLIPVEHRLLAQGLLEFVTRRGDRVARFFPGRLRAAQTDRHVQGVCQQGLHQPARDPTHHGEVRDQRRELRAELAGDGLRHGCLGRLPARRTHDVRTVILRHVRRHRRQFGHLMPAWRARHAAAARRQRLRAMPTRVREHVDHGIHTCGRHQRATMAGMPRLAARFAAALRAAAPFPWTTRQAIGRRRLRGGRRVLMAQRQLPFQVRDLLLGRRQLLVAVLQLPPKTRIFDGERLGRRGRWVMCSAGALGSRPQRCSHSPYGTPITPGCTG